MAAETPPIRLVAALLLTFDSSANIIDVEDRHQ
jgi:hypothetical protein